MTVWCSFIDGDGDSVLIGGMYRSPNSTRANTQEMYDLLNNRTIGNFKKVCIMGDFNFPMIKWKGGWYGNDGNEFVEQIRDALLIQKVRNPTRRREGQTSNILDLVLVNDDNLISEIEHCTPLGKSDHEVLMFTIDAGMEGKNQEVKYRYNLNKGNYELMNEAMLNIDWYRVLDEQNVDQNWIDIKEKILQSMEEHIPMAKVSEQRNTPRWVDNNIRRALKRKYNLYQRFLRTKTQWDYTKYTKVRNNCAKLIRKGKRKQERTLALECKKNPKNFWKHVQGKIKHRVGICPLQKDNGQLAIRDDDKANTLNEFFSSVFTRENNLNIPAIDEAVNSNGITLADIRVTPTAVIDILGKLNKDKAQGPDRIPPRVLIELRQSLGVPLSIIFNQSLETGRIPLDWKKAEVTAIFKKGRKSTAGNYRPVSLTCVICKVLETIIRNAMVQHMDEYNLYSNSQHGFRKGRSCTTQLLQVMETLTQFIDEGKNIDIIYLDFRKAFDQVPHKRLLSKLSSYGFTGMVLNWISHFLSDRTQKVRIGDKYSREAKVLSGIPQGSILGPILFTIFINDLPTDISSNCNIFADDTKIFNIEGNCDIIQHDLNRMQEWSSKWLLYFNADKCKVLHIGRSN